MSSTEQTDALLRSFYETEFVRAARILSAQGARMLEAGFDENCETYFTERRRTTMEPSDFELSPEDPNAFKQALQQLWTGPEAYVLAGLMLKILALSPHFTDAEVSKEVSPLIYAMF